jgi:hypothetical protein
MIEVTNLLPCWRENRKEHYMAGTQRAQATRFTASIASFENVRSAVVEKRSGVKAVSAGWGLESDFPVRGHDGRAKGGKGTVFFVLIGWGGVDEVELEHVRKAVALLVEMENCVAWDEFSVECEVLERSNKGE